VRETVGSADVVVITGPVGAGKTAAMGALAELLADHGQAVAMIDLESLRALWHVVDDAVGLRRRPIPTIRSMPSSASPT
jgi:putative protein kinase ArgK-like GTPase of G3E family